MMTNERALTLLDQWIDLLTEIETIEIDCDLSPEHIAERLERRQRAIDQIQQLDAPLMSVRRFREAAAPQTDVRALDTRMRTGRDLSERIYRKDLEIIELAKGKKKLLSDRLKNNTLSKGYLPANQGLKVRPPAIVDSNA